MLAGSNVDKNWSEKKMEGDDGLRTMECLRGRLLAERVTSRVAKEDAELMSNKLIEVENQLKEEIKSRNKAEKKLKFLMIKLESLKIPYVLEESEHSSSSENIEIASRSSTISSGAKDPEEKEPKSQVTNSSGRHLSTTSNRSKSPATEEFSISPSNTNSDINPNSDDPSKSCELQNIRSYSKAHDNHSSSSSKSSMVEAETNGETDQNQEDYVDNSLALVPATFPATSETKELKIINQSVCDVLAALQHAKEELQSSMERRHMIKVGLLKT